MRKYGEKLKEEEEELRLRKQHKGKKIKEIATKEVKERKKNRIRYRKKKMRQIRKPRQKDRVGHGKVRHNISSRRRVSSITAGK